MLDQELPGRILRLFETIHPLDRIARAGYVLRGVPHPENVSAHSHFVSVLVMIVCDACPDEYDKAKALTMAIIHDLCEAVIMDIPMPAADAHFAEAKRDAEQAVTEDLFTGYPAHYAEWHAELNAAESPEARLVRAADKAQMMIKIHMYEKEGAGRLHEFWGNPKNFNAYGIAPIDALFDRLCEHAGVERPKGPPAT